MNSGIVAVLLALLAAVPWSFALSGPDGLLVAFALAPPLAMAFVLGLRWPAQARESNAAKG